MVPDLIPTFTTAPEGRAAFRFTSFGDLATPNPRWASSYGQAAYAVGAVPRTEVRAWRVLAGASPSTLRPLLSAPKTGFETAIALPGGTVGPYLAVQALNAAGAAIGTSAPASQPALR